MTKFSLPFKTLNFPVYSHLWYQGNLTTTTAHTSAKLLRHTNIVGKAWFKRRILHAPNQILILVDSNEYVRLM